MCLDQPTDGDKIRLERVWRMCFIGLRSHHFWLETLGEIYGEIPRTSEKSLSSGKNSLTLW